MYEGLPLDALPPTTLPPDALPLPVSPTVLAAPLLQGVQLRDYIGAAIALVVGVLLGFGLRWAIGRLAHRGESVNSIVQILARLVFGVVIAVAIYIALGRIGVNLGPLLAGAGILGIAVAFALQDIAENYISGILLGLRRPFSNGDQIISGEFEGTVEDLNLRYTRIRTYDGLLVLLPNGGVLKNPLTNLSANGLRRTDISLGVAYGTDLGDARRHAIAAAAAVPDVLADPSPEAWVEELAGSWITIRVRFWHGPLTATMWRVRSDVLTAVLEAMDTADIALPFEHTVVQVQRQDQQ